MPGEAARLPRGCATDIEVMPAVGRKCGGGGRQEAKSPPGAPPPVRPPCRHPPANMLEELTGAVLAAGPILAGSFAMGSVGQRGWHHGGATTDPPHETPPPQDVQK